MLWFALAAASFAQEGGNFIPHETTIVERLTSFAGIFILVALAWLISENRKAVNWRPVAWGVGLQLVFGAVVLSPVVSSFVFTVVNGGVNQLLAFSQEGTNFVFGSFQPHGILVGSEADVVAGNGAVQWVNGGTLGPAINNFAFSILPTIVFFSALMSLLYHLGVMQVIVKALAAVMMRTLGTSGAESLSAAGNIFVGQTEAPLLVKPFVANMTRSELMAVMTGGFATVAGGVLGAYVSFLSSIPDIAGHLVTASIISAPAALAIAKVIVPETEESLTAGDVKVEFEQTATNAIEAAANGAADGMKLALNVAAMLIAIVALVAMADFAVGLVPIGFCESGVTAGYSCAPGVAAEPMSLARIFGWLFAPIALVMGVPFGEATVVGRLLAEKIVLTEFIAYINLGALINGETPMISQRGAVIASYALCGFANFASIGIQLGGIGGIAPKKMGVLAELGFRAMWGGVIAACMTGAVAGIFL